MWLVIIGVVVAILFVFTKIVDALEVKEIHDQWEEEKRERENDAIVRKEKLEILTEDEKQELLEAGGEKLLNDAINAFNEAVNGNTASMLFLSSIYKYKVERETKVIYWLDKASQAGNLDAKYFLGRFHIMGYGVDEYYMNKNSAEDNRFTGVKLICEAAEGGNEDALECLINEFGKSIEELREMGINV